MNNWKEYYESRCVSVENAIKHIHDNDRVVVSHAAIEPSYVLAALMEHKDDYHHVEIIHMVGQGKMEYCKPEYKNNFHHVSAFASGKKTKQGIVEGYVDVIPTSLSLMGDLVANQYGTDVFVGQVSPPNKHGYCTLGMDLVYERAAINAAKTVIMQVNPNVPKTYGDSAIPVEDIDYFVACNDPIIELPRPRITDVEMELGRNCASLIEDGSTLQLGIGSLPDAICLFLKSKKDLGIHSEMISDGVMELMQAGIINNSRKTLHTGKTVAAFAMGTKALYEYLDDNPDVLFMDASYVNDSAVIAQNDKMISINSCVEIDFTGQVASESIGSLQISGTGGQTDFVRGAVRSKGGKSLMVLQSTTRDEKISKIVPQFGPGAIITTPRTDVDYVVTEYGVAHLRGQSTRVRAKELIKIAHPKFRDELIQTWEEMFRQEFPREELG